MPKLSLIVSVSIIFIFSLISFFAYWKGWKEDLTLNLATELLGVVISVVFIDLVINYHKRIEKLKFERIALRQLKIPLNRQLDLLVKIYKASTINKPNIKINKIELLFTDDFYAEISNFDFSKTAPVIPEQEWMDYIQNEVKNFDSLLNGVIEKYSIYLDSVVIDILEELNNSSFSSFLKQIPNIRYVDRTKGINRKYVFLGAEGMKSMIENYISNLCKIIEIYNLSVVNSEGMIKLSEDTWREDVSPKIGSAR